MYVCMYLCVQRNEIAKRFSAIPTGPGAEAQHQTIAATNTKFCGYPERCCSIMFSKTSTFEIKTKFSDTGASATIAKHKRYTHVALQRRLCCFIHSSFSGPLPGPSPP